MPCRAAPLRLVALVALAAAGAGCSTFRSSRRLDLDPFAENTVTAMGELRRLGTPPIWVRLRPLHDHPSVVEARREAAPLYELARRVTGYSLQLVALHESRLPERKKVKELARFIRATTQQATVPEGDEAEVGLTSARLDAVLADMEGKETYREALEAAEPIVNAVLARGLALSEVAEAAIVKSAVALEKEVQGEYATMLRLRADLLRLQARSIEVLVLAESSDLGDGGADEALRRIAAKPDRAPAPGAPAALSGKLARIQAALDQLEPDYKAYRETLAELDGLRLRATEGARLIRSVLLLWARSHKNLARGVEVPAAFDLARLIGGTAGSALGKVVPF